MFVEAIEKAAEFTRPVHVIYRHFQSSNVQAGTATLFFVNSDGWALTCQHVAQEVIKAAKINKRYQDFKVERRELSGKGVRGQERKLFRKYGLNKGQIVEMKVKFVDCIDGRLDIQVIMHRTCDVALLKFSNYASLGCSQFPKFVANATDIKPGQMICRLGYPFPEFDNFAYDTERDEISWCEGKKNTPRFPIEGMVTRHVSDQSGGITGFELSTPGLRGQSGGPAFDADGRVLGMQSLTHHEDLNFDVDVEVLRNGKKKRIQDSAFLHLGCCVHVNVLKEFMRQNQVQFEEE